MKKNYLKMVILATLIGVIVSACGKDEVDAPINETPTVQNKSLWPVGVRLTGGDSCVTTSLSGVVRTLWRVDSMLSIYYYDDIVLPDGFCTVLPIYVHQAFPAAVQFGDNAAVVIFKGDREYAINKLMQVDGIYAINPVYQSPRDQLLVPGPFISGSLSGEEQVSDENVNQLMSIAEELHLRLVYFERFTNSPFILFTFLTEYSLVNSVVATDIIKTRCNVHFVQTTFLGPVRK